MPEMTTTPPDDRSGASSSHLAEYVVRLITDDAFCMQCLQAVAALNLPDWAIGAGFVRNVVSDHLHGFDHRTPLPDIDVLYFDPTCQGGTRESELEQRLAAICPKLPWSVRNQARMHLRNGDQPYHSTEDAMGYWLEKPTAVAVRLSAAAGIEILAPFGLQCLIEMRGEPTPSGLRRHDEYIARMQAKDWPSIWSKVKVDGLASSERG